jgi:hypothetical protein
MKKQLESRQRDTILAALYNLQSQTSQAKLRVETYGTLYDQFDDLLRQVDSTVELLEDLRASPPRLAGDRL